MYLQEKHMKKIVVLLSFILIQSFALIGHTSDSEFLPVEEAFIHSASVKDKQLHVQWSIADHYYLYQSRIKAKQGDQTLDIAFAQTPIEKEDEYFGKVQIFKHALDISVPFNTADPIKLSFQGCAEAGLCYPPVKLTLDPANLPVSDATATSKTLGTSDTQSESNNAAVEVDESDISSITAILENGSMAVQLLIFFALGLGLAFTPCVFPMIPILSSIIVGQGENLTTRRAFSMSLSYVLAMAVTYAIAGVIVGYFGATANVALYLQSPWVLGTFAGVFVLLSLSMFGLYELALPRFIQDKLTNVQQKQEGGSLISVAIMGAVSALVVSPCVSAPLAGTLVYISTTGDALLGGLALLALGLGMGVPLLIIGTGGGKFLPKAGMWMDGVKNVFGVALLAIAIWLLERVVPASVTLMLWGVLLIGTGVFLGAFEQGSQGWKRLFKALGIIFSLYGSLLMIGSAAGQSNPLAPLSFMGSSTSSIGVASSNHGQGAQHTRITTSQEFEALLAQANQDGKVLVLDFYADWCIACKVMDAEVFSQPEAGQAMKDVEFVQLDMTDNTDNQLLFLKSFNLFGPPAVLFFKDQQEISDLRIVGDLPLTKFLSTLKNAKNS
jgi:thiol:disulfide interchange protein DsbD